MHEEFVEELEAAVRELEEEYDIGRSEELERVVRSVADLQD
ncbi:hypothetical protein RYH80_05955 [Halobaculum sp. MBLA0147]